MFHRYLIMFHGQLTIYWASMFHVKHYLALCLRINYPAASSGVFAPTSLSLLRSKLRGMYPLFDSKNVPLVQLQANGLYACKLLQSNSSYTDKLLD